jgi:protoporphyrinogen oxidase
MNMADLKERIAIIGGGPAGLSAAMYLEKKGYTNYVIYEKDNRVGGKCYSPKVKMGPDGKDERSVEMGAIMGAKTYYAVHECEEFGGVTHADGPSMSHIYRDSAGKQIYPFDLKKDFTIKKFFGLLKLKKALKKLAHLLETKYVGYDVNGHRGVAEGRYDGLDKTYGNDMKHVEGTNDNLKDLALPFSEFCKLNKVEPVMRIWIAPFTSFGYGFFDEMAAAYVLKYLDLATTLEFVNIRLWTWKEGTQSIYEAVNKKLQHPAILNTQVAKVERGEKVKLTLKDKEGEKVEEFDKLIVTTPLDQFLTYADAGEEEKNLFSKIIHEEYVDFLATFAPGKGPDISAYIFDNMVPDKVGHAMVYYHRWHDLGSDCPCTVYTLRNHKGVSKITYEEAIKIETEDMAKCGFPVASRPIEWETYYCPHVSTQEYANGWYDKLDKLQGVKNTYYGGEVLGFGDMEETVEVSKDLVGRFF